MRYDRIIPLRLLCDAPGSDELDMTFCYPKGHEGPLFVYLLTEAERPVLRVDDQVLNPRAVLPGLPRWISYGPIDGFETATPFGQLRVLGMTLAQARAAQLLIATRADFTPSGTLAEAERALFGLSAGETGSTALTPSVVPVCTPTTFECRYSAGRRGLPPGARLRFSIPLSFAWPQTERPEADGFMQFQCARPVECLGPQHPNGESHEKVYLRFAFPQGLAPGETLTVRYHTDHTHMVPHAQGVEPLLYWYSRVPVFYAEVAADGREQYLGLPPAQSHAVEFVAREAEALLLTLPGIRRSGAGLRVEGRYVDALRNYPPTGVPETDLLLTLRGADEALALGAPASWSGPYAFSHALPDLKPGVWRVEAHVRRTGALLARSNPVLIDPRAQEELYWGEIHCHSRMSDGIGDYDSLYGFARHAACLDFACGCDHACYFSDNQWQWMQSVTNARNEPGRFVTLVGYEWAGKQVHRNLYTARDRLRLFRGMYGPTSDLATVYGALREDDQVVSGCHAPMAHGIDWSRFDPQIERYIEVYSMWGRSDLREPELAPIRVHDRCQSAHELMLGSGARLGFTGGGDCHEAKCGLTCREEGFQGKRPHHIYRNLQYASGLTALTAPTLDRPDLIRALRARKTYATTGLRTLLSVSMDGVPMGGEGVATRRELRATVHACLPLIKARILRDGAPVAEIALHGLDASFAWRDEACPAGEHSYAVIVAEANDNMTFATPVWLA